MRLGQCCFYNKNENGLVNLLVIYYEDKTNKKVTYTAVATTENIYLGTTTKIGMNA